MPTTSAFRIAIPTSEGVDEGGDIVPGPHHRVYTNQVRPIVRVGPDAAQWLPLLFSALDLPFLPGGSEGVLADDRKHPVRSADAGADPFFPLYVIGVLSQ